MSFSLENSSKKSTIIAIDSMGGDEGPCVVIEGLNFVAQRRKGVEFQIYGPEKILYPLLQKYPALMNVSRVIHCDSVVHMEDKPTKALRYGRQSSMWKAIESVKNHQTSACVSTGNTGALMAMAKISLSSIGNVNRPAIAAIWPTLKGKSVVLDVGATIGANAEQLIDFAILGVAMAQSLGIKGKPKVGLLNIGIEPDKGLPEIKEASKILQSCDLDCMDFKGFVEGTDIGKGIVDVLVTEGFVGNIALKTAEGTAYQIFQYIRQVIEKNFLTKLFYFLSYPIFYSLKKKLNIRQSNGGVFLGLNGIIVKSHGSSDSVAYAYAVDLAIDMSRSGLLKKIERDLADFYHKNEILKRKENV